MIKFNLTSEGTALISGSTNVTISGLVLIDSNGDSIKTITDFVGNSVDDDSGIGDYLVIDFEDTGDTAYSISSFGIKSGDTTIATSEPVSVAKQTGKHLKIRLTAQFDGADKCSFAQTTIGLPYATSFRQGVVRFYNPADTSAAAKKNTIYSAYEVDQAISSGISTASAYIPWDVDSSSNPVSGSLHLDKLYITDSYATQTDNVLIKLTGNSLDVGGVITGDAVTSTPSISAGSLVGSSKLVNETYISDLYTNEVSESNNSKLVTSKAVSDYVSGEFTDRDNAFVHIANAETITGAKTFTAGITSNSYEGSGVYSSYTSETWASATTTLPTVSTVRAAISEVTTACSTANADLQSQIDALNAGQNLTDIVDARSDLASYAISNLKAKNDTVGESTYTIGDKIQVLHDKSKDDGTTDSTADGIATVYELIKGTKEVADLRDFDAATSGYYWHYIGTYGCNSYSKSESDTKFVAKASLESSITDSSPSDNAPSAAAVYTAINSVNTSLDDYVTISTDQNITGDKSFKSNLNIYSSDNNNVKVITSAGGGTSDSSAGCNIQMMDGYKYGCAVIDLNSQRNDQGVHTKVRTSKFDGEWSSSASAGDVLFYQGWGKHYGVVTYDSYLTTAQSPDDVPLVGAWHDRAPEFTQSSGASYSIVDDNAERIRIRRTVSTSDIAGGKYNGTHTFIDLYADHIVTLGKDIHYKTYVDSAPVDILTITTDGGVHSTRFTGGYEIGETQYSFGSAGSLSFTTTITETAADTNVPTEKAVKDYVDTAIEDSAVSLSDISGYDIVGAIGLFIYTEPGAEKSHGDTVNGQYLRAVGMTLPLSGQISYKSAAFAVPLTGTWKLLSLALKRTSTDHCLVLAQKISN